jgi:hypothetical protein
VHTWLGPHAWPQLPQFCGSLLVLTHELLQFVSPLGHVVTHWLEEHA